MAHASQGVGQRQSRGYIFQPNDARGSKSGKQMETDNPMQGSLNGTHLEGNQTIQMYGNSEGFPLLL